MKHSPTRWWTTGLLIAVILASAPGASAQTVRNGSIAGSVKDDTGASLPGVTVTVTSPALQVAQLTRVSDDKGEYQFVDLPLGTYRMSFELSGFTKLVREGITLTTGFAARVDASLRIATMEETVTVSGASPVVDVTNTRGGATLTNELLETIPNNRTYNDIMALTPGMSPSAPPQVGQVGFGALAGGYKNYGMSGQERVFMDGVNMQSNEAPDFAIAEEVDTKTFGTTAESPTPGAQIQIIVKSGGNAFHGRVKEEYVNDKFASSNIDDALRAQGISAGDSLMFAQDIVGDLGGRIVRDKLWFYGAVRHQKNARTITGYARDAGPDATFGTADDVPGEPPGANLETTGKLSYQASAKHRFVGLANRGLAQDKESFASRFIPFETTESLRYYNYRAKGEWQGAFSDRLLAEFLVGDSWYDATYVTPDISRTKPSTLNRATQIQSGHSFDSRADIHRPRSNMQVSGSLSYFPAAMGAKHELKTGYSLWWQQTETIAPNMDSGNYQLVFDTVGGLPNRPVQLNAWNRPVSGGSNLDYYAAFVTDQWRVTNRLTANLGLRYERSVAFVPEQVKIQGPFGSAGTFPRVDGGTWNAIAPRAGVAFDLTGNGKSVLKATYGWYNHDFGDGYAATYNQNTAATLSYRWSDPNGNRNYDPGEINLDVNGPDFINITGTTNPIVNLGITQPKTQQFSVSFERELAAAVSTRLLYVNMRSVNLFQTVNPLRPYSAFNIPVVRLDPGPDGVVGTGDDGGNVTLYDYAPAFRGGQFLAQTPQNRPEGRDDSSQSLELLLAKRHAGKWSATTSILATKYHRWLVGIAQSPNDEFFPLDETWEWNYRLTGSYQARYGINLSVFYTLMNGTRGQRTYLFRNLPQLSTQSIRLEPFGAHSGPVRDNLNLKVAKRFTVGPTQHLELSIDALNATNSNVAWTTDYTSGPTFGYATRITTPRMLRFGVQFDF
jgi:Carboxypeptidase regulatory-like domain